MCLSNVSISTSTTLLLSLDISAVFNTKDRSVRLNRLVSSFGIISNSHNCVKSYLSNRSFSITSGSTSSIKLLLSYVVFLNALLWVLSFSLSMFLLLLQLYHLILFISNNMLTTHYLLFYCFQHCFSSRRG